MARHPRSKKTTPRDAINTEKGLQALELRKAGYTYAEIGKTLGVSMQQAHRIVIKRLTELRERVYEEALQVQQLECERLDGLFRALWPKAQEGDTHAVYAAVNIMGRRAKLLGLDAPVKYAVNWEDLTPEQEARLAAGENPTTVLALASSPAPATLVTEKPECPQR